MRTFKTLPLREIYHRGTHREFSGSRLNIKLRRFYVIPLSNIKICHSVTYRTHVHCYRRFMRSLFIIMNHESAEIPENSPQIHHKSCLGYKSSNDKHCFLILIGDWRVIVTYNHINFPVVNCRDEWFIKNYTRRGKKYVNCLVFCGRWGICRCQ